MSKHTPGPWYFDGNDYVREKASDYLIARIEDECGHSERRRRVAMPQRANARLIAAAPETAAERDKLKEVNAELLAALKAVMGEWKDGYGLNCVEQVRAAIDKAEGKS